MEREQTALSVQMGQYFGELRDPRQEMNQEHKFLDIFVVAICAILCGAEDWVTVAWFGKSKEPWLRTFLELPHGIPSHDTFWRVFRSLDAAQFEACCRRWVKVISTLTVGEVVAIDGKQLRRSHDHRASRAAITLVSAWATANGLLLGQRQVSATSNEMTAIPDLLHALVLKGCLVTVDAMNTQTAIAQAILDQEADYLLALKNNHRLLYAAVALLFSDLNLLPRTTQPPTYACQVDKGHGRIEIREAWVLTDPQVIRDRQGSEVWPHLQALVKVQAQRRLLAAPEPAPSPQEPEEEPFVRYYLASLPISADQAITATRAHWQIENTFHWALDVACREDQCRLRKDHGAHNFAILRRIALNLLKQDQTKKAGIKNKRLVAGWDHDYLLRLLQPLLA